MNMLKPAITAARVISSLKCNRPMKSKEPSHETVAYRGLSNTTGVSLQSISRNIPPMVPVITPMKLANNGGAPTIKETNEPAMPKVAKPAASATKKNFGGIAMSLAAIKIAMALPSEAMKNT